MFKILHVDNSYFFRKIIKDTFDRSKFKCFSAEDVDSAFDILKSNSINLIITAIEIRGGGGETFIDKINRTNFKNIPIIVVTSNDSMEVRKKMFTLGVVDYIPKDPNFTKKLVTFVDKLTEETTAIENLKKMKIAVLDDSRMELNIIKNILSLNKITDITFFNDPENLLQTNEEFDIYFIDLVLPKISGEQVILELRNRKKTCIIIAVSSIDNYKVVSSILLSGADDYMLKPFNASIFLARLVSNVRSFMLVQEIRKKNIELKKLSITDSLTGLYNHKFIFEKLESEIEKSKDSRSPLSIIIFSLDLFSYINDRYGHYIGDRVLQLAAKSIKTVIGKNNTLGRYGGVEFLVILPETSLEEASKVAEVIRKRVNKIKIKNTTITISGGVAQHENEIAMDLIKKADSLLFNAKKDGKNKIQNKFIWKI